MLNNNKVDLVDQALKDMSNYIYAKSQVLLGEEALGELIQCVSALRRGCDEQQERNFWDDWLDHAKGNLNSKLYDRILHEGLLYLKKDSRELFKKEELHPLITTEEEFADLD
jgi:hypothetical protein